MATSTSGRVGLPGYGFHVAHGGQVGQQTLLSYVKRRKQSTESTDDSYRSERVICVVMNINEQNFLAVTAAYASVPWQLSNSGYATVRDCPVSR